MRVSSRRSSLIRKLRLRLSECSGSLSISSRPACRLSDSAPPSVLCSQSFPGPLFFSRPCSCSRRSPARWRHGGGRARARGRAGQDRVGLAGLGPAGRIARATGLGPSYASDRGLLDRHRKRHSGGSQAKVIGCQGASRPRDHARFRGKPTAIVKVERQSWPH